MASFRHGEAMRDAFLSGAASAPWFFANGLTPTNQGADAAPLRCRICDRPAHQESLICAHARYQHHGPRSRGD